ncbi:MAG: PepSY domain-containing protein [Methylococcaceae bacterium]|nr:PepSY domain-containing protein [Methylococcaceae bacterium]
MKRYQDYLLPSCGWVASFRNSPHWRGKCCHGTASPTVGALGDPTTTGKSRRLSRLKARRKLWLEIHLWLGLIAGAVLLIVGLTGSILVFWQEIDAWLNPELMRVEAPAEGATAYRPLSEIVAEADAAMPSGVKRSYVFYPQGPDLAVRLFYEAPSAMPEQPNVLNAFVNPYTAQVTGTRLWQSADSIFKHCFMGFIFELHYDLLLGWDGGSWIVGVIGILAFISVLTGLIVWWPLTGKWRQALTIKRSASAERLNFDLHKTFGFYSALVLLAVLISGVYFNFGEQFRWLVDQFSVTTAVESLKSTLQPGLAPISLDAAMAHADIDYPEGQLYLISVPNDAEGVYVFTRHFDFGGIFRGRCQIVLDQYTGQILHVADPLTGKSGNVFLQWQWPLHSGQALRMGGRILVLLSGIACATLFVTGVIRWTQKRRARSAHHNRL